jgi:predicted ATPase
MDLHLGARVCAAAHGGQIVCTAATHALVQGPLHDLGFHRLRDIPDLQRLYQVGEGVFPPLRGTGQVRLPTHPNPFIGRTTDLEAVVGLLGPGGPSIVTLLGPGGIGKTRLAIEAAREAAPTYRDGVSFISLADVTDAELALPTIARVLEVTDPVAHLADKEMLLVVDNLEQLAGAGTVLGRLMRGASRLRMLATSRQPLRMTGEHRHQVSPLPLADAMRLFGDRAEAVGVTVGADEAGRLCARLEGLPLAVELAAARSAVLSADEILSRLDTGPEALGSGPEDAPDRQRTLRDTVAWSYSLLPPAAQRAFSGLAVFVGGWTRESADAVLGVDLDTLVTLVESSLVQRDGGRFSWMWTIQEVARNLLAADAVAESRARRAHAEWARQLVERESTVGLGGSAPSNIEAASGTWRTEHDNLAAALDHLLDVGDRDAAYSMFGRLWTHLVHEGHMTQAERWCVRLEELLAEDSIELAWILAVHSEFPRFAGEAARAIALKERSLGMLRRMEPTDESRGIQAGVLRNLASLWLAVGESGLAHQAAGEALAIRVDLGRPGGIGHALEGMGEIALREGRLRDAADLYRRSADASREAGYRDDAAWAAALEADVQRRMRTDDATGRALAETLQGLVHLAMGVAIPDHLQAVAGYATSRGHRREAAVLLGAAAHARDHRHWAVTDPEDLVQTERTLSAALGASGFREAQQLGRDLSMDAAVDLALQVLANPAALAPPID